MWRSTFAFRSRWSTLCSPAPNNTLDFSAAIRALGDHGDGDMVTIRDDSTTVRVWVDDSNEGNR